MCLVQELICEDISRRIVGSGIIFNAVFFETDVQQEGEVLLSGRHGTSDQVATCLQSLAAAGGGRFHHSTLAGQSAVARGRGSSCPVTGCCCLSPCRPGVE